MLGNDCCSAAHNIMHIRKNADPNRKRRGFGFLAKLNPFKRRKKKEPKAPNQEVEQNVNS